jgi:hypothetical protein
MKLGPKRIHLRIAEFFSFRVCQQAIDAPRNMADLECYRREISRTSVQLGITQIAAPLFEVFPGQLKRVQHCPLDTRNIGESTAQPRFWKLV